jgi:hypothetical protein
MTSSGLSRRRVQQLTDSNLISTSTSNVNSNVNVNTNENHKVAFDSRDIIQSGEDLINPRLTLMEEVLLLGLKDKQVKLNQLLSFLFILN